MAFSDHTFQNAATATGDGTALEVPSSAQTLVSQVSGTFSATIVPEASLDGGTTDSAVPVLDSSNSLATEVTSGGIYRFLESLRAYTHFRWRISVYASGSVTVKGRYE